MKYERSKGDVFLEMEGSPAEIIQILDSENEKQVNEADEKIKHLTRKINQIKQLILFQDREEIDHVIKTLKQDNGGAGWALGESLERFLRFFDIDYAHNNKDN